MSMSEHKTAQISGDQRSSAWPRHSFSLHEGRGKFPQKTDNLSKMSQKSDGRVDTKKWAKNTHKNTVGGRNKVSECVKEKRQTLSCMTILWVFRTNWSIWKKRINPIPHVQYTCRLLLLLQGLPRRNLLNIFCANIFKLRVQEKSQYLAWFEIP